MEKRTVVTLIVAVGVLGAILWPGLLDQSLPVVSSEGGFTGARLAGILSAAFLGITALHRSERS